MRIVIGVAAILLLGGAGWSALGSSTLEAETSALETAIDRILLCRNGVEVDSDGCVGAVYVWSESMPLSREGIAAIREATEELGIGLAIVDAAEIDARGEAIFAAGGAGARRTLSPQDALVAELIDAGATVHYPSILVHRSGRLAGAAILGYKTADAYRAMIGDRLDGGSAPLPATTAVDPIPSTQQRLTWSKDFPVQGRPGAYFKAVAGRQTLAFEVSGVVRALDLTDGGMSVFPGSIDFVPSPDGRVFVTPLDGRRGLAFYDAEEVFLAARRGDARSVEPVYLDRALRDQYPSVGILQSTSDATGRRTVYRVLTSWFDRIVFRDYEVRLPTGSSRSIVRPLTEPVTACPEVSTPILAPNGREVAGRAEESATTRIFRITESGECQQVEDLGRQTGKVAWSPDGRKVAFAVPTGANGSNADNAGIFVHDRATRRTTRVTGSESAYRPAFPEFVGPDTLAYLISPNRNAGVFRLVCCIQ